MSEVKKNEATEVAVASGFAAVANAGGLNDMTEDLAGLELTFDRIKIPSGDLQLLRFQTETAMTQRW